MPVCVSVVEASMDEAVKAVTQAKQRGADLVEVRFDLMDRLPEDLTPLKNLDIPKIATLRSEAQGGRSKLDDAARLRFLRRAARAGFTYVDLENNGVLLKARDRDFRSTDLIISHHDLEGTPPAGRVIDIMLAGSAKGGLAKGAFTVRSVTDLHSLVSAGKLLGLTGHPFVLLGMGELGKVTRFRYDRMGSAFTFASLEPGKEAAPGQVDLATMREMEGGVITGLTGTPLGHSVSPAMHDAAFRQLGIPGRYLLFPAQTEELGALMELVRDLDIQGLNVTIPHKEEVVGLMDRIDPVAERVGAVNVVVNDKGRLVGKNTDVSGLAKTFEKAGASVRGKRALVIGAGGAARACCAFLASEKASIFVTSRTFARAEEVARTFSGQAIELNAAASQEFDVVVNCTPAGMKGYPSELPIDPGVFRPGQTAMDVVYNPIRTPFLAEAEARGAKIISGMEMLIYQAMDAFEAWTGQRPPYEVMAGAARTEQ